MRPDAVAFHNLYEKGRDLLPGGRVLWQTRVSARRGL